MNWLGGLVQERIGSNDTVLSIGCGVMQEISGLRCKSFTGIDIYQPYVDHLKSKGIDARFGDIVNTPVEVLGKYDNVLMLDVIEHIEKCYYDIVVDKCKSIATKRVFIYTPAKFNDNVTSNWNGVQQNVNDWLDNDPASPYKGLGVNKAQRHVSLITHADLTRNGFSVWSCTNGNYFAMYEH